MASWQPHDITIKRVGSWFQAQCSCGWRSVHCKKIAAEVLGADHQGPRLIDHVADRLVREHGDILKKLGEE